MSAELDCERLRLELELPLSELRRLELSLRRELCDGLEAATGALVWEREILGLALVLEVLLLRAEVATGALL